VIQNPGFLPDQPQNWITGSCCLSRHSQKISERSVHNFLSYLADTETDRQTKSGKNITSLMEVNIMSAITELRSITCCMRSHKSVWHQRPKYLSRHLHTQNCSRTLRSSDTTLLNIPFVWTNFAKCVYRCAFSLELSNYLFCLLELTPKLIFLGKPTYVPPVASAAEATAICRFTNMYIITIIIDISPGWEEVGVGWSAAVLCV